VVPNLMISFGIDEQQAEYVAEIKLRHLNREYILKRLEDIDSLQKQIEDYEKTLNSKNKVHSIIIHELEEIIKNYAQPRKTTIISSYENEIDDIVEEVVKYPVNLFVTKQGYFKKITPLSLRMGGEQKFKEGDELSDVFEANNADELLFFTDKCQVYKSKVCDFEDTKASVLGEYVNTKLNMDSDEKVVGTVVTSDYKGSLLFCFQNGRVSKVSLSAYATKTNRKKLINAFTDKFTLCKIIHVTQDCELLMKSSGGRMLLLHTGSLQTKVSKSNNGVAVMTQKKGQRLVDVEIFNEGMLSKPHRYRTRNLPAAGSLPSAEEVSVEQLSL
ncbi:MAG: topoisomerase IV, partial [bacterium]|nr:topoisomerase IV [bacterium]